MFSVSSVINTEEKKLLSSVHFSSSLLVVLPSFFVRSGIVSFLIVLDAIYWQKAFGLLLIFLAILSSLSFFIFLSFLVTLFLATQYFMYSLTPVIRRSIIRLFHLIAQNLWNGIVYYINVLLPPFAIRQMISEYQSFFVSLNNSRFPTQCF